MSGDNDNGDQLKPPTPITMTLGSQELAELYQECRENGQEHVRVLARTLEILQDAAATGAAIFDEGAQEQLENAIDTAQAAIFVIAVSAGIGLVRVPAKPPTGHIHIDDLAAWRELTHRSDHDG